MRTIKISKRNGSFRTVYVPGREKAAELRSYISAIEQRVSSLPCADAIHGFRVGRSPVSMAHEHVGRQWTVCMDLEDFFPHCTRDRLAKKISGDILDACLVDGHAAQGLPSSPALANLAASDIDQAVIRWGKKNCHQIVYTRYADDITVSGDDLALIPLVIACVRDTARRCGFRVNDRKTAVYRSSAGRRMVCGVSVGEEGVRIPRATRRRLRAAQHQARLRPDDQEQRQRAAGLAEWARLRTPREVQRGASLIASEDIEREIRGVCKAWGISVGRGHRSLTVLPDKGGDVDLGGDCLITCDPVMHLGMSTYTTGWTSCMRHPSGSHRRGTSLWAKHPGSRIAAYILPDRLVTHGGVSRPAMRARALVHRLRIKDTRTAEHVLVYDRLYGGASDAAHLEAALRQHGAISVTEARSIYPGARTVGNAPHSKRPYLDNLASDTARVRGRKAYIFKIRS